MPVSTRRYKAIGTSFEASLFAAITAAEWPASAAQLLGWLYVAPRLSLTMDAGPTEEGRRRCLSSSRRRPRGSSCRTSRPSSRRRPRRRFCATPGASGFWAGFHTLRHTCATALFLGGWNAKQVQMFLGHHSPAFTLATYVHLLPDDLPDAPPLADVEQSVEQSPVTVPALETENPAVAGISSRLRG